MCIIFEKPIYMIGGLYSTKGRSVYYISVGQSYHNRSVELLTCGEHIGRAAPYQHTEQYFLVFLRKGRDQQPFRQFPHFTEPFVKHRGTLRQAICRFNPHPLCWVVRGDRHCLFTQHSWPMTVRMRDSMLAKRHGSMVQIFLIQPFLTSEFLSFCQNRAATTTPFI